VAHATDRIGAPKTASARAAIEALNPEVRVVEHRTRLSAVNAAELIGAYDIVVDGTDNFATRYVVNDAAVRLDRPVVHASVYRWEGQVTTLVPFQGPCYRCLHPSQPPDELAPDCAVAGVLGVLPGMLGTIQAAEVLKLVLGTGEPLVGRLLLVDAATAEFREVRVERDPACPACGGR
jgi:molybdopterin/thiamine biosynthesis adenylyltransferase